MDNLGLSLQLLDEASLASLSASEFPILGTWFILTSSKWEINWLVSFRYLFILSSFTSYLLVMCPTTNFESIFSFRFLAHRALATLRLVRIASYSASLIVARNWSLTLYLRTYSPGEMATTPTLPTPATDDPSMYIIQYFASGSGFVMVNSVTKSANT